MYWLALIQVLASATLTAVILGFWKPWTKAYGEEKGKNLARKEDLDAILAEVRAVTIAQKEIESKLSSDLWTHQNLWNQKKEAYLMLLASISQQVNDYAMLPAYIRQLNAASEDSTRLRAKVKLAEPLQRLSESRESFSRAVALTSIFSNQDCTTAIAEYVKMLVPTDINSEAWATGESAKLIKLLPEIIKIAKADLHVI